MRRVITIVAGLILCAGLSLGQTSFADPARQGIAETASDVTASVQAGTAKQQGTEGPSTLAQVEAPPQQSPVPTEGLGAKTSAETPEAANPALVDKLQELKSQYSGLGSMVGASGEIVLEPKRVRNSFNLSGDTRSIYTQLGSFFWNSSYV